MRKLPYETHDASPQARRSAVRAILAIVLGLAISPIVYEASALCASQWRSMNGPVVTVQTPVLDALVSIANSTARGVMGYASARFRAVPWRPSLVIPMAFLWAGVAALLLRRR